MFAITHCSLPYTMGKMEHLKSLVLDGNPLKSLRRDVVMVRITLLLINNLWFQKNLHTPRGGNLQIPVRWGITKATWGQGSGVEPKYPLWEEYGYFLDKLNNINMLQMVCRSCSTCMLCCTPCNIMCNVQIAWFMFPALKWDYEFIKYVCTFWVHLIISFSSLLWLYIERYSSHHETS